MDPPAPAVASVWIGRAGVYGEEGKKARNQFLSSSGRKKEGGVQMGGCWNWRCLRAGIGRKVERAAGSVRAHIPSSSLLNLRPMLHTVNRVIT